VNVGLNDSVNQNLNEPIVIRHSNIKEKHGNFPITGRKLVVKVFQSFYYKDLFVILMDLTTVARKLV